ncbi:MAG TPA: RNA methyltransferase [Elusimicrobiales bacterium]|nr:RNA methyltransferase [Elusimicrobiales bacterium]
MTTPLKFILVKPRNPDNIGACARAMANFGLTELALVSPFESDWEEVRRCWKQEASVAAINSMDIIESARIYGSIPEAAEDCQLLLGTSSLHQIKPDRDVIVLKDAPGYIAGRGVEKAAILFGPEKTGLTKEDLALCNAVINIPTLEKQPSMNLGQSVALLAYELAARQDGVAAFSREKVPQASAYEIDRLTAQICAKLDKLGTKTGSYQTMAISRGLLDARLTKNAVHMLKLLLKN